MREELLHMTESVFGKFDEVCLVDISSEEESICAKFTYQDSPLKMYVFNPDNTYLRSILVCIEDRVADELKIPPHYIRYNDEKKLSSLCLLDKEQHILSSYDLPGLIELYLSQAISLLSLSPRQKAHEYLKEFEYYWNSSCELIRESLVEADVYLPKEERASLLNCWYTEKDKHGKYVLLADGTELNYCNAPKGSHSTALYIPIEQPLGILPPQKNTPWNARDLLNIVYNQSEDRISSDTYDFLKKLEINNYQKVVVFSFALPDSVTISFAGIISFGTNEKKSFITKVQEDFKSFVPILSTRMDMKHLHERVGQVPVDRPPVLLLGCGSVGSYLLPELVNMGFTHIGVSDPDMFVSGNSLRHYLGPHSSGSKKAVQMQFFMEYENPQVSIDIVPNILEQKEDELAKTLEKYHIVIVAVGGTDIQRKMNYLFSQANSKAWHLFNWLDAEGKGAHVLAMRYSQKGCFDCLFYKKGELSAKNKVTYSDGTEKVIGNGCGGSFSPYGNNVLIRNTSLAVSMLHGVLDGSITQNTVASIRNDFSSLASSISMTPVIDEDFAEEGCDICGNI